MDKDKKWQVDFYYIVLDGERDKDGLRKVEHIKKAYMTLDEAESYFNNELKPKYDPNKYCVWYDYGEIINKSE